MRNTQNATKSLIFLGSPAPVTDKNPIFQTHEPPNSFRTQELINKKVLYQKFSIFFTVVFFRSDFFS